MQNHRSGKYNIDRAKAPGGGSRLNNLASYIPLLKLVGFTGQKSYKINGSPLHKPIKGGGSGVA